MEQSFLSVSVASKPSVEFPPSVCCRHLRRLFSEDGGSVILVAVADGRPCLCLTVHEALLAKPTFCHCLYVVGSLIGVRM